MFESNEELWIPTSENSKPALSSSQADPLVESKLAEPVNANTDISAFCICQAIELGSPLSTTKL